MKAVKRFTIFFSITSAIFYMALLAGCVAHQLKAPCPNYGASCSKTPINSWNDN